jgi:hypothetical protein
MTLEEAHAIVFMHLPRDLTPVERMEMLLAEFMQTSRHFPTPKDGLPHEQAPEIDHP